MSTKTICKIDGCDKPVRARKNEAISFVNSLTETDECIIWPYSRFPEGYGRVQFDGRVQKAHRVALIIHTGEDPKELYACHTCHNRLCVNPRHLYFGTPSQNQADRVKDGTHDRGERCVTSKLTADLVLAIRSDNRSQRKIAKDYGIAQGQVSRIKTRKQWAWLD